MMRRSALLLAFLALAGCSAPQVVTNTVVQHDVAVALPVAQPLVLNDVQWHVITVDQLKTLAAKLQAAQDKNVVIFALDAQNYTGLQLNLVEIQRYIKEQKAILDTAKQILADRSGQPVQEKTDKK